MKDLEPGQNLELLGKTSESTHSKISFSGPTYLGGESVVHLVLYFGHYLRLLGRILSRARVLI